nr:MAG TPA: hypothetical protein [Caudoviricetes sp.]
MRAFSFLSVPVVHWLIEMKKLLSCSTQILPRLGS